MHDSDSQTLPPPFLKLPFRQQDGEELYVSQGWLLSPDELLVLGEEAGALHGAIDFEFPNKEGNGYGLPILAAADGRAYYSYQYTSDTWTSPEGKRQVGIGAGLVVEIRHDQGLGNQWVTQYIHLAEVAETIPYLEAVVVDDPHDPTHPNWHPAGIIQPNDLLWEFGVPVRQGDVIGCLGDTGIGMDWKDDFNPATGQVTPRNREVLKPWDPAQLHFQLYRDRDSNGNKRGIVDPFGLRAQVRGRGTDNPYSPKPGTLRVGAVTAWITAEDGSLVYAAD